MSKKKVTFKDDSLVHYYNNTSHEDLDSIIARVTTLVLKELKKQSTAKKPPNPRKTPQKRKSPKQTRAKNPKKKAVKKKKSPVPKSTTNTLLLQEVDTPISN